MLANIPVKLARKNKKPIEGKPMPHQVTRRQALQSTLAWAGASVLTSRTDLAHGFTSANERPRIAAVGTGSRWYQKATGIDGPHGSAPEMRRLGDYTAVCDADSFRLSLASGIVKEWTGEAPNAVADYRAIIDDKRIDIVHISTPDHWHAKMRLRRCWLGRMSTAKSR